MLRQLNLIQLVLFLAFIAAQNMYLDKGRFVRQVPPAIESTHLKLVSFGEAPLLARGISIWLQTYDIQSGKIVQYETFNYAHLIAWFDAVLSLNSNTQYPLLSASRIFIESKNPDQVRQVIDFVHQQFLRSPAQRWRWQLDIAMVAKHRLKDLSLAKKLTRDLNLHTQDVDLPDWIRSLEHLVLAEMGEVESAIIVIDGLLNAGLITDANELRFLTQKLKELSSKVGE